MASDRRSRPEAKALRLFVAIEIPSEAKRAIGRAIAPWREAYPRARWAPEENWHVTLKFLGGTYPRLERWVHERVAEVAGSHGTVAAELGAAGAFPSPARARVLWVGVHDDGCRLAGIAEALDRELSREFPAESRGFRAHVTVARSEPPVRLPSDQALPLVEPVAFEIGELVLFRSHLRRPAPIYEALRRWPLVAI